MPAKLVAIGDSVTEGFLNGSISKTHLAYPAFIANCLGDTDFKVPDFCGAGGLPLNLEDLLHHLDSKNQPDSGHQAQIVQQFMDTIEDYWERGEGTQPASTGPLHRNLSVWGFQIPDCDWLSDELCQQYIEPAVDHPIQQQPEHALYRTVRRTLNPSQSSQYQSLTQLGVAQEIAKRDGIDNLIFWLGSNHCLDTVVQLKVEWSTDDTLNQPLHLRTANLWRPEHFKQVLHRAAEKVSAIGAKNVFVGNVPHVTVPPVSRGVSPGAAPGKEQDADGYYEYYTHFWIWDSEFDPAKHPHLTRSQVREIDATVDEYNRIIQSEAALQGWHLVDTSAMLDKLAIRRQCGQSQYSFPPELIAALRANPQTQGRVMDDGTVLLDTRYYRLDPSAASPSERVKGGLFSLDGAHPSTVGQGLIAYEFLQVMQTVWRQQGESVALEPLDWSKIVASDSLLTNPPASLAELKTLLLALFGNTAAPNSAEATSRREISSPGIELPHPLRSPQQQGVTTSRLIASQAFTVAAAPLASTRGPQGQEGGSGGSSDDDGSSSDNPKNEN